MYTTKTVINPDGTKNYYLIRTEPVRELTADEQAIQRTLDSWGTTE
jgi:hypothetical protein